MIVKAAVARRSGEPLQVESLEIDDPKDGEILVRLIASGVAQADLDAIAGGGPIPFPFVPGGEGAGIVERVGVAVDGIAPGDTVILTSAFCGRCAACLARGETRADASRLGDSARAASVFGPAPAACTENGALNASGTRRDGTGPFIGDDDRVYGFFGGQSSFATHVLCRRSSVVPVAADAPLEVLACLGGEVQRAAAAIIHGFSLEAGDDLVITGAGASGLCAVMAAHALGAKTIIVTDPDEARRTMASKLGATITVHTDDDLAAVVRSMTGAGARYALETTGHAAAREACLASLRPGGTCGLLQAPTSPSGPDDMTGGDGLSGDTEATGDPVRIVDMSFGSGSSHATIVQLADWHVSHRFPIETLVAFFPFEHVNDALQALATGAVVKPVIRFSLGSFGTLDRAEIEGAAADAPLDEPQDIASAETADAVPAPPIPARTARIG